MVKLVKKGGGKERVQKARASQDKCRGAVFRAENLDGRKVLGAKMWNLNNIVSKKVKLKVQGQVLDKME